jgi:hypothetical protein
MRYNILLLIFIFVVSCKNIPSSKPNSDYVPYKNSGFALIYNPDLHKNEKFYKKINNENMEIGHNILKKNSILKITNPENMKSIELKITKKINYSPFYKIILSQ